MTSLRKNWGGISFNSHKGRSADICVHCHTKGLTGFKHADEWFAQPGLYTFGMNAQQTCEATKTALHTTFKNSSLIARQLELHLLEDPRVLWAIKGATPKGGLLPGGRTETDLVQEDLRIWKERVKAWIQGGMKYQ